MTPEEKKAWACEQLVQKNTQLGRLPKKEDFDEATRSRIKAFLGPWPRALEAAGLKQAKPETVKSKKRNAGKLKACIGSCGYNVFAEPRYAYFRTDWRPSVLC